MTLGMHTTYEECIHYDGGECTNRLSHNYGQTDCIDCAFKTVEEIWYI